MNKTEYTLQLRLIKQDLRDSFPNLTKDKENAYRLEIESNEYLIDKRVFDEVAGVEFKGEQM